MVAPAPGSANASENGPSPYGGNKDQFVTLGIAGAQHRKVSFRGWKSCAKGALVISFKQYLGTRSVAMRRRPSDTA